MYSFCNRNQHRFTKHKALVLDSLVSRLNFCNIGMRLVKSNFLVRVSLFSRYFPDVSCSFQTKKCPTPASIRRSLGVNLGIQINFLSTYEKYQIYFQVEIRRSQYWLGSGGRSARQRGLAVTGGKSESKTFPLLASHSCHETQRGIFPARRDRPAGVEGPKEHPSYINTKATSSSP